MLNLTNPAIEKLEPYSQRPWIQSLISRIRSPKLTDYSYRRDSYRLPIYEPNAPQILLTKEEGKFLSAEFQDLSAGGFACQLKNPMECSIGEEIRIAISLPIQGVPIIKTHATLVYKSESENHYGFKFSEYMGEDSRDMIHQFIIRRQFEIIKENKAPEYIPV